jgi:hypothetical protein
VAAIVSSENAPVIIIACVVAAGFCYALYRKSRREFLTFRAASGEIVVEVNGDEFQHAARLLDSVLAAKNDRVQAVSPRQFATTDN